MSAPAVPRPMTCLLVFGVVDASRYLDGAHVVRVGRVAAITEAVSQDVLAADDERWVADLARRHDGALRRLVAGGPVLPMRLGTVCADDAQLAAILSACEPDLADGLERVRDRSEWRLRVRAGEPHPAPDPSAHVAESGTSYLLRRSAEQRSRRALPDLVRHAFGTLDDALVELADAAANVCADGAGSAISRSYLVPRGREDELDRIGMPAEPGVDITLVGPLPPYSFVNATLRVPS